MRVAEPVWNAGSVAREVDGFNGERPWLLTAAVAGEDAFLSSSRKAAGERVHCRHVAGGAARAAMRSRVKALDRAHLSATAVLVQQATTRWNGKSAGVPAASKVCTPTLPAWSLTVARPGGAAVVSVVPTVAE